MTYIRGRRAAVALLIFAAMGLCPPWVYTFSEPGASTTVWPAGYHPIFYPPEPESSRSDHGVRIDFIQLLLQWTVVAAIAGALAIRQTGANVEKPSELLLDSPVDDGD